MDGFAVPRAEIRNSLTENTMRNRKLISALALTGAAAILASCSSMSNMMGGGGQHVALSGANEVPAVATDRLIIIQRHIIQ